MAIDFSSFLGGPGIQLPQANTGNNFSILPAQADMAKMAPGVQLGNSILPGEWDWMNGGLAGLEAGFNQNLIPGEQPLAQPPSAPGMGVGGGTGKALMTEWMKRTAAPIPKLVGEG